MSSLVQIMEGCREAQDALTDSHARICPRIETPFMEHGGITNHALGETATHRLVQTIEFDVAVSATEESATKGGIGVLSAFVGAKMEGESGKALESVSRLKFSIPVCYPEIAKD
jgi:hypothetical protein